MTINQREDLNQITRRGLLKTASCGFGYLAFRGLCAEASARAAGYKSPLAPRRPHFQARAKRVIFLFMQGGPSHVDTFDYKPELAKYDGKSPGEAAEGQNSQKGRTLKQSPWKFNQHGESGLPISTLYPHLSAHADQLCLLNGSHTDIPNHPQALVQLM